mgnify:CR=1 FL=1
MHRYVWLLALAASFSASIHAVRAETPEERGAYLVKTVAACGNCHTPRGPDGAPLAGKALAGGVVIELPVFTAVGANITPDVETGIGGWSDEEIATAIREGKRPDGTLIGPPMPFNFYRHISDRDVHAIVAYLRTVPAVANEVPASQYRVPLPDAYGPPVTPVPEVPRDDKVAYGAYLAGPVGHCLECHTPRVGGHPDLENRPGAGGMELPAPGGGIVVAPNITPHPDKGIGGWSDAEIRTAITRGVRPDGTELAPVMAFAWYANMSDEDLDAIVAYLRTLKPVSH